MHDYINNLDKDINALCDQMTHAYELMKYYDGVSKVGYAMARQAWLDTKAEWKELCAVSSELEKISDIIAGLYLNHGDAMRKYEIDI